MLEMLLPSPAIYEYVIKEDQYKLPQMTAEDMVHARLKGGWCIGQPKRHNQNLLKVPIMTPEGGLGNVLFPHANVIVP